MLSLPLHIKMASQPRILLLKIALKVTIYQTIKWRTFNFRVPRTVQKKPKPYPKHDPTEGLSCQWCSACSGMPPGRFKFSEIKKPLPSKKKPPGQTDILQDCGELASKCCITPTVKHCDAINVWVCVLPSDHAHSDVCLKILQ